MRIKSSVVALFTACAAILTAGPAVAQQLADGPPGPPQGGPNWSAQVGGGALFAPSFVGDDNYQLFLLPSIRASYGERLTVGVPDGLKYDIIRTKRLRIGPNVRPSFGRNEDGRQPFSIAGAANDDLLGLGDVDPAVEVGGYAEYRFGKAALGANVTKALGGHDGVIADVTLRYNNRKMLGCKPLFYSVGPSVRLVDQTFHQSFYGVTAAQSAASGLAVYEPEGGLNSYGLSAAAIYPIRNRVSATVLAGYDRLAGEVAESSLVSERGARDQANLGLFLTYRFGGR